MATLKEVQQRIVGVQKTQKITRAMKIVAATKLKKCERDRKEADASSQKLEGMLKNILRYAYHPSHPLLSAPSDQGKTGYVLIGSDRGLCGAFNSNMFRKALDNLDSRGALSNGVFAAIGRKALEFTKKNAIEPLFTETNIEKKDRRQFVGELVSKMVESFNSGDVSKWVVISNRFTTRVNFGYTETCVMPLSFEYKGEREDSLYHFEDSVEEVLDYLIPKYVTDLIYTLIAESQNAEEFSRMMAMDYATENADELIGELTLNYNRTRQQVITTELTEIVGGAEALK